MSTLAQEFGCSPAITCPGSDLPLLNLSSESPDEPIFIGTSFGPVFPPPPGNHFTATGCLGECDSTISQEDADLCAARQAALCVFSNCTTGDPTCFPPNTNFVCNTPQTGTANCPDGLPFNFTVPGGLFCGLSQTLVDEQAHAFAVKQAQINIICLGSLPRCVCLNSPYSATIPVTGLAGAGFAGRIIWSIIAGSLPPGLSIDQTGTVSGTPTVNGTYTFTIRAVTQVGTFMEKPFTIVVLEITTISLPPFTIGVPYTFQVQAVGGSGNYSWRITNGSLPNGLTMSITGLITGTPV